MEDITQLSSNPGAVESVEFIEALAVLPPQQAAFVKEYVITGSKTEAVRRAGYKAADPANRAYKLSKIPKVAAAIEAGRRDIAKNARYDANAAMVELNSMIEQARSHNQMMPAAKIVELKMKLCGLLIDRLEISEKPDLRGALIEARRRSGRLLPGDDEAISDAEPIIDVKAALPFKPDIPDPFGD
jgi:hypothetical protein